jgi:hypothetical protein
MTLELVKREDHYGLYNEDGHKIASTLDGCNSKLSKENCDELFGVFDVETLSDEYSHDSIWFNKRGTYNNQEFFEFIAKKSFIVGFNKAMELNKDKLFTVEDLENFRKFQIQEQNFSKSCLNVWLHALQPPTEIEVEIEMVCPQCQDWGYVGECEKDCNKKFLQQKLDKNGCLILKKRHEK